MILPEQRESFANAYHAAGGVLAIACASCGIDEAVGRRLLMDGVVNIMLAHKRRRAAAAADVSAERVLQRLAAIAFADTRELAMVVLDDDGAPRQVVGDARDYSDAAVALYAGLGPRGEVKAHDQMAALKLLAAYTGIVSEAGKPEPSGEIREIVRRIIMPTPPVTESLDSGGAARDTAACDPNMQPTKP